MKRSVRLSTPKNETREHFRTKIHIRDELSKGNSLTIAVRCSTKQRSGAPNVAPFWTCGKTLTLKNWLNGWSTAVVEHSVKGIGKFDVALLGASGDVVGAIEVLRSSGMTDKKLEELSRRGIPWVEVPADPDLYMSNKAWNIAEPLPVITSSLGDYYCDTCAVVNQPSNHVVLSNILGILDVHRGYPAGNGSGVTLRKVFALYDLFCNENSNHKRLQRLLVEGSYVIIHAYPAFHTSYLDSELLSSFSAPVNADSDLQLASLLSRFYKERKLQLKDKYGKGSILVDILPWNYERTLTKFAEEDKKDFGHLVSYNKAVISLQSLYPTIQRRYPLLYNWHKKYSRWYLTPAGIEQKSNVERNLSW